MDCGEKHSDLISVQAGSSEVVQLFKDGVLFLETNKMKLNTRTHFILQFNYSETGVSTFLHFTRTFTS